MESVLNMDIHEASISFFIFGPDYMNRYPSTNQECECCFTDCLETFQKVEASCPWPLESIRFFLVFGRNKRCLFKTSLYF